MTVDATTPADVCAAVLAARDRDLPVTVYATGHGGAMPDGDVMVVMTAGMGGVVVDPERRVARVGAGVLWGEVVEAAAPHGLAPLSGTAPEVGVVGYTLGGGMSWLSRMYGFAADSVVRAQIVTADGELRTVSADQEPDLFWAIRGGGGNFGVVTELEFRLYPVTSVYGGAATFPLDRAADVLRCYRDAGLPDELTANLVLTPDELIIRGMYVGPADDARRVLTPLFPCTPLTDDWRTMPYTESGTIGATTPENYTLQAGLSDALIAAALDAVHGDATAVEVRPWGGAIARPGPDVGPLGHRDAPYSVIVDSPAETAAPIVALATGGSFLNGLTDPDRTDTVYSPEAFARLREIKHAYDPDGVFTPLKAIRLGA